VNDPSLFSVSVPCETPLTRMAVSVLGPSISLSLSSTPGAGMFSVVSWLVVYVSSLAVGGSLMEFMLIVTVAVSE